MSQVHQTVTTTKRTKSETRISGNRPHIRLQAKGRETVEQTELWEALDEALNCTACAMVNTESALSVDINSGAYIISKYPPYFPNYSIIDEERISPLDTESTRRENSIWKIISSSQHQRYYEQVEQHLNWILEQPVKLDDDVSLVIAHYYVDAHIQRHYLDRRSMLAFCRDEEDLEDFREWRWAVIENCSIHYPDITPYPVGNSKVSWPNDDSESMAHQEVIWNRTWQTRGIRVEKARAKWALIKAERQKQREELLAKQRDILVIRLYFGGELRDVRRVKMYPDGMPESPTGTSQSFRSEDTGIR